MNEDFLHYLWKYKKINSSNLKTTDGQDVVIIRVGDHNETKSGPDFFNTQLIIDNQKWAGNVEIHLKSSDWYRHHHEIDPAYDNVVLHVVWEDDMDIFRKDNSKIPTLQLKEYLNNNLLTKYQNLFCNQNMKWIQCEKQLPTVSSFTLFNWQERLYVERLEQKSQLIIDLLEGCSYDWEAVLFKLLAKGFGLNVNSDAFLSLANSFDFSILRKCCDDLMEVEALLFGQANLLDKDLDITYVQKLIKHYEYLKRKYHLENIGVLNVHFFRLRPPNFPTIRISQLANLYVQNKQLFSSIIKANDLDKFYELFDVSTSDFWRTHYTFTKDSSPKSKKLTKPFIDLIIINTIIPLKFIYAKVIGVEVEEDIFRLMSQLPYERNSIVDKFTTLGVCIEDALHSQAMIHLKINYCDRKACLKCAIGNYLLNEEGN
ncbi:DUF2851 family protein [Aquimarina litoralis]|uniref:DUF2851 family protein n=1 Tax=Aquimarina litoralis TaxID=584605 RepID=UPI001C5654B4|nr:DUF2851 family protein [Aquimarina litoralis]MBW1295049.1 DUF2851 family protein [Aquimarina litoralis]